MPSYVDILKLKQIILTVPPICKRGITCLRFDGGGKEKVQACTLRSSAPIILQLSTSLKQIQHISLCWCHVMLVSEAESRGVACLSPAQLHACTLRVGPPVSYCPHLLLCTILKPLSAWGSGYIFCLSDIHTSFYRLPLTSWSLAIPPMCLNA